MGFFHSVHVTFNFRPNLVRIFLSKPAHPPVPFIRWGRICRAPSDGRPFLMGRPLRMARARSRSHAHEFHRSLAGSPAPLERCLDPPGQSLSKWRVRSARAGRMRRTSKLPRTNGSQVFYFIFLTHCRLWMKLVTHLTCQVARSLIISNTRKKSKNFLF